MSPGRHTRDCAETRPHACLDGERRTGCLPPRGTQNGGVACCSQRGMSRGHATAQCTANVTLTDGHVPHGPTYLTAGKSKTRDGKPTLTAGRGGGGGAGLPGGNRQEDREDRRRGQCDRGWPLIPRGRRPTDDICEALRKQTRRNPPVVGGCWCAAVVAVGLWLVVVGCVAVWLCGCMVVWLWEAVAVWLWVAVTVWLRVAVARGIQGVSLGVPASPAGLVPSAPLEWTEPWEPHASALT